VVRKKLKDEKNLAFIKIKNKLELLLTLNIIWFIGYQLVL